MRKVLPILFNTEMVRAILDERKTVTRRAMKPQPLFFTGRNYIFDDDECPKKWEDCDNIINTYQYQPGDILYVRETWQHLHELDGNEQVIDGTGRYYYAATDTLPDGIYVDSMGRTHEYIPWRPSIHMPKKAARIWLKVTDVRVERLQEMDCEDAMKEGIDPRLCINLAHTVVKFKKLWDSTIKKSELDCYGWAANPWVWVIEFERCEKPEREV